MHVNILIYSSTTELHSIFGSLFVVGNTLNSGDNIPWHLPLDGHKTTAVRHMLITNDAQLDECKTPHGTFQFRQVGALVACFKSYLVFPLFALASLRYM